MDASNPFERPGQNGPSLREDAQQRTAAMMDDGQQDHYHHLAETVNQPNFSSPPPAMMSGSLASSSGFVSGSSDHNSDEQSATPCSPTSLSVFHPLEQPHQNFPLSSPEMASQARQLYRQHGEGVTQALEEKRRLNALHGSGLGRSAGTLVVRVLSAETRVDLSGAKYTTYVIRVQFPTPETSSPAACVEGSPATSTAMVEHRYSEFAKLNALFQKYSIVLDKNAAFPSKHLAGRIGNWTPSMKWAPDKHKDLVSYRTIQLDVWLVHVVDLYNQGQLPLEVAQAVYEFLAAPTKPPCENDNDLENDRSHLKWLLWNNPVSFTLGSSIRQATRTVEHMCTDPFALVDSDQSIPLDLLHAAKGLCFMTVVKAGLVVSGRIGTGLLVARMDDSHDDLVGAITTPQQTPIRWSAPCALGTLGVGYGALIGGDVTHYLIVLTTTEAVQNLCSATSVQLGAELGVAMGPIGRGSHVAATGGDWTIHPAYAYAHSQGLFVGMSLEGSVVSVRNDVNAKFYGQHVIAQAILNREGPKAAGPLYQALNRALHEPIPEEGFRPSALWNKYQLIHTNQPHPPQLQQPPQTPMSPPPPFLSPSAPFTSPQAGDPALNQQPDGYHGSVALHSNDNFSMAFRYPPSTIETINSDQPSLFDPTSPGSSQHW